MSGPSSRKRSLFQQPLLHFLLIAAVIFAVNKLRGEQDSTRKNHIVVTVAQVERMADLWAQTWGRPASESELQELVRDHIKEEIFYREALKLGLDINDIVIRQRLRQKMEFFASGDAETIELDNATLQAFYKQNLEKYRESPTYDFEQIYFADEDEDQLAIFLTALQTGTNKNNLDDSISLPRKMTRADELAIVRNFGSAFYKTLGTLEVGTWYGPVVSGFGQHVVKINRKEPASIPKLSDIRMTVENDWRAKQHAISLDTALQTLRSNYIIEIEAPTE